RKLNQDIIESIIDDKTKAGSSFSWLESQPFLLKKGDHWIYHNVVRDQMLRFVRTRSMKEWLQMHHLFISYYQNLQNSLQLTAFEQSESKIWKNLEFEKEYHVLCVEGDKYINTILQRFVKCFYEDGLMNALGLGELLTSSGLDSDSPVLTHWGTKIVD